MKIKTKKFNTFGKRVEFIRTLCDMTQHEIAEAIEVSVGTWQRFVYGKSEMRRDTIRLFLEVTGADRDWVEGYSDSLILDTGNLAKGLGKLDLEKQRGKKVASRNR